MRKGKKGKGENSMEWGINLSPHVKRYLQTVTGSEKIELTNENAFGSLLQLLLTPPPHKIEPMYAHRLKSTRITGSESKVAKFGSHFGEERVIAFNSFIDDLISKEFIDFVTVATELGGVQANYAINCFLNKYNWSPEELSFDSLKKKWSRHKQANQQFKVVN